MPRDADKPAAKGAPPKEDPRRERLARALRDNLKKRKAQHRQRQTDAAPPGRRRGDGGSPGGG